MAIYEMNNARKDSEIYGGRVEKTSPVVEVFSAMVNGESLDKFGKVADKAVNYIKDLGDKAENGDTGAIAELNTIRRFVVEGDVMEEMNLLSIFGSYTSVGFDETVEREVEQNYTGERSRLQANNGDVVFPITTTEIYTVPTFTVSGGYAVDYRRVAKGDMSKENRGLAQVKTDILNNAKKEIINRVYKAIKNATGVKYTFEGAGLTKSGVDGVLLDVRRNGRPTVIGDYSLISQFTPWVGYVGTIGSNTITGISQKVMDEIAANGAVAQYNGAVLTEMKNPYNKFKLTADGKNYETLLPAGLGFVLPTGGDSPIATYTRGGLTSFTGNDVHTGKILTRFDIEVGVDVAKGQEDKIGLLYDTNIGGLD
jgi:hypothetical protein